MLTVALAASAAAQVTLSLERYEELRGRARPLAAEVVLPAAPWAVEDVELDVDAGESRARVTTTFHLTVFANDWQTIPFAPSGSIVAADFGGAEGRVDASSGWSLRLRGAGRRVVRLESVVPVERDPTATRPTWRFALQVPMAAAAHGRLLAPAVVEETGVEGAGLLVRPGGGAVPAHGGAAAAPRNEWLLLARPGQALTLTLAGKAATPQRTLLPLRYEANAATVAIAARTTFTLRAWIEARVLQGRLDELRVPLPEGFAVANVGGALAGWKTVDHDLVVTPPAPVESVWGVAVTLTGAPRTAFTSPILAPRGAVRVRTYVAVATRGGGLASVTDPGSARAAETDDLRRLPDPLRAEAERFYAVPDPARPPRFTLAWAEGTEVLAAQIDRLLVEAAIGDAGRASYRVWAEVRNRGAQQLVFELPEGFELATAARDAVEVRAGRTGNAFALPLAASERPQVVRLAGLLPLSLPASGDCTLPLPRLSAPAARVEVRLVVGAAHTITLADPTRAGHVGGPPQQSAGAAAENVAQEAVLGARRLAPVDAWLAAPLGTVELQAAWNALSAAPQALALHCKTRKEDSSWN